MVALAALFGALAGVAGALVSSTERHLPTGPMVVLSIGTIAALSLVLAPNRGLLWNWVRQQLNRRRLRVESVLGDMYALARQHQQPDHPHSVEVLRAMNPGGGVERSLRELEARGWARRVGETHWALTDRGVDEARWLARRHDEERP